MRLMQSARVMRAGCMALALASLLAACSTRPNLGRPQPELPAPATTPSAELGRGKASWYGPGFHGKRTASGERFDMNAMTAAHRTLAFGTRVLVRNVRNGREVIVRINDRGPHVRDRIIDLSKAAAAEIDLIDAGEAPVVLIAL